MIRILVFFIVLAAAAFGLSWLADNPGTIALTWQGQRIETSLLVGLGAIALLTIALIVVWKILSFIFHIPSLMSLAARTRRRNKGFSAISRGMVAASSGDNRVAGKAAREASRLLGEEPLAMMLEAQAAQLNGDRDQADKTFKRMLEHDDTRVLGLRGLYLEARRRGDEAAAQAYAREAHSIAPLPWASQAMLEHNTMSDDWSGALSVVESAMARKTIDKPTGNRQRAVLKTATGQDMADRDPDQALQLAREAIKLAPDLVPAYVLAGKMLARRGDVRRGARVLEDGWRASPHPEIAATYLNLRPGDSSGDRLSRAKTLTKVNASHPEARMTLARAALEAREFDLARKTMEPLIAGSASRPTVRMCLLMADIEETQHGETGAVREWLSRATRAPRDPMWIADGIVTDTWAPASPVTGKLDAFQWEVPVERLTPPPVRPAGDEHEAPVLPPLKGGGDGKADAGSGPAMAAAGGAAAGAAVSGAASASSDTKDGSAAKTIVVEAEPVETGAAAPAGSAAAEASKPAPKAAPAAAQGSMEDAKPVPVAAAVKPGKPDSSASEKARPAAADGKATEGKATEGQPAEGKAGEKSEAAPSAAAAGTGKAETGKSEAGKSEAGKTTEASGQAAKPAEQADGKPMDGKQVDSKQAATPATSGAGNKSGNGAAAGKPAIDPEHQPDDPGPRKRA